MKIAVLALQGAYAEHEMILRQLGIEYFEIRKRDDLKQSFDGLILPGGESTVMGKLLRQLDLMEPLKSKIEQGMPVLATCAGLILLADKIENDSSVHFQTLPVTVKRNAYGRQLGSFKTQENMLEIGKIPMTFIRAPYIIEAAPEVKILAEVDKKIVAVRYKNQLAMSFHPELTEDSSVHKYFLEIVQNSIELC